MKYTNWQGAKKYWQVANFMTPWAQDLIVYQIWVPGISPIEMKGHMTLTLTFDLDLDPREGQGHN